MSLKFAANLSFMFKETPNLVGRYQAAKSAGFKGVECGFLYDVAAADLAKAKETAGLQQVLINSWPGDLAKGERGLASLPNRTDEFAKYLEVSIDYAKALRCNRLHIMAGIKSTDWSEEEMMDTYKKNLTVAAKRLEQEDIMALIEPINNYSVPNYFMNSYEKALDVLQTVKSPNLKLQLDIFHLQHLTGNLTNMIKSLMPFVGHIQIAQVPDRHEPNTSGEINYNYIFQVLLNLNYDGWIGCEYVPADDTVYGLNWVHQYGLHL